MVSPTQIVRNKTKKEGNWPEYKNRISFLKRGTRTWFNGKNNQKKNPSMFQEFLGEEEEDLSRGAEALWEHRVAIFSSS